MTRDATRTEGTATGRVDYLVGGVRIRLDGASTTPGPTAHIKGFTGGLGALGLHAQVVLASDLTIALPVAGLAEGSAQGKSSAQVLIADLYRLAVAAAALINVARGSRRTPPPTLIYERVAVLQCMNWGHRWRRRVPVVVESNGIMSRETAEDRGALRLRRVAGWMERRVYRRADLVVAVSESLREEVVRFAGIPEARTIVVRNAIPDGVLARPVPNSSSHPDAPIRIGFVGTVVDWQQLDLLIEAVAQAPRAGKYLIDVIGDGPALPGVRATTDRLGLSSVVRFHGRLDHAAVERLASDWSYGYAGHKATSSTTMYHSPLKVWEYAGAGAGLITTSSEDARYLASAGVPVHFFNDLDSLVGALDHAVDSISSVYDYRTGALHAVRRDNDWRARASEVLKRLDLPRPVDIGHSGGDSPPRWR